MANNPVKITETILRDAHQSLCATRMRIEQMVPQLEALDAIGFSTHCPHGRPVMFELGENELKKLFGREG